MDTLKRKLEAETMDPLKRKLDHAASLVSSASSNDDSSKDTLDSSSLFTSPERPKRLKNDRGRGDDVVDDVVDDDDSALIDTNPKFSHSVGFNPASVGEGQWKPANYRSRCSSSNEEEDEDHVEKTDEPCLEDGGACGGGDDADVNLVLDLLMKKVCLESDDSVDSVLDNLF